MSKYLSRAKRASILANSLRTIAGNIDHLIELEKDEDEPDIDIQAELDSIDFSEAENLKEELESWRDGMQGTNLENSEKFSILEDAINILEDVISALESLGSDPEEVKTALENVVSDLESIEFPGMYS